MRGNDKDTVWVWVRLGLSYMGNHLADEDKCALLRGI